MRGSIVCILFSLIVLNSMMVSADIGNGNSTTDKDDFCDKVYTTMCSDIAEKDEDWCARFAPRCQECTVDVDCPQILHVLCKNDESGNYCGCDDATTEIVPGDITQGCRIDECTEHADCPPNFLVHCKNDESGNYCGCVQDTTEIVPDDITKGCRFDVLCNILLQCIYANTTCNINVDGTGINLCLCIDGTTENTIGFVRGGCA